MKKIYASMMAFVIVALLSVGINAKENNEITNVEKEVKTESSIAEFAPSKLKAIDNSQLNSPRFYYAGSEISISKNGTTFWRAAKTINNVQTITSYKGYTVFLYQESGIMFESWYRNSDKAHIKNVVTARNTNGNLVQKIYNYHFIKNRCYTVATNSFSGDNCTNLYKTSSIYSQEYQGTSDKVIRREVATFNNTASEENQFLTLDKYSFKANALRRVSRIEAPRDASRANKVIGYRVISYHNNGRVYNHKNYGNLGLSFNGFSIRYSSLTNTIYNSAGKMTRKTVGYVMRNRNSSKQFMVYSHNESRSYYKNMRVKQVNLHKKNYRYNLLTQSRKTVYRSNGKKYTYKLRTYKRGKAAKQTFYKYNAKGSNKAGGAYRIVVNYNKKGKATKAMKAKYNKKGKLGKAKKQKLTKSVVNF